MAPDVENWDDDADFQGDLFTTSNASSAAPPSILSSRMSVRSESAAGDEDWQVLVTPNDASSTANAISSAKQVGIPIPQNIPPSALLGGTITKLQKKKSKRNVKEEDCDDLEIPDDFNAKLKVKANDAPRSPTTPANTNDEFDADWAEGSLGIRFGGTRRELRNRSSSISAANSAMSPSMGSCLTIESEEDELGGLVLPDAPIDFGDRLKKRKELEKEQVPPTSSPGAVEVRQEPSVPSQAPQPQPQQQRKLSLAEEDPLSGLDLDNVNLLDNRKRKLNINIKINDTKVNPSPPRMATTTLTFTDKPTVSRIPRPAPPPGKSKLDPVYESMASHIAPRNPRPPATTTGAQLLRSKRSAPALGARVKEHSRPPVPFLSAGVAPSPQSNVPTRPTTTHGRNHSDHDRPPSPPSRSFSRMSVKENDNAPSRTGFRRDILAPISLARQALNQRTLNVTKKRQNFGNGSELDNFDDLPTSATKESKFLKEPTTRGPPKTLRHQISRNQLRIPDRMNTPQPQPSYPSSVASTVPSTPLAPPTPRGGYFALGSKPDSTPRFARDTAASRIRADQRINPTVNPRDKPGGGGPLMPLSINWKAQVAARSPHASPTSTRKRKGEGKQPILIKQMTPSNLAKSKS